MIYSYAWNAAVEWSIVNRVNAQRWNTSGTPAFEAHSDANWANYLISDTQVGTSATRYFTIPATLSDGDFQLEGYDTDNANLGDVPDLLVNISVEGGEIVKASRLDATISSRGTYSGGDITGNLSGSVGSVAGNVGGNVTGSVGSISGVSFPTNFSTLGITAGGHISRVTLVDTTTDLTNLPTIPANWLTAAGIEAGALDGKGDWSTLDSGDVQVVITPIHAVTTNPRYSTRDLPPIAQASASSDAWTITDSTGAAVNLSGKTVRLVAYLTTDLGDDEDSVIDDTLEAAFEYETGGDGIVISGAGNNVVNLTHSVLKTATPGNYRYWLWNITDEIPMAKGRMPIEPSVKTT